MKAREMNLGIVEEMLQATADRGLRVPLTMSRWFLKLVRALDKLHGEQPVWLMGRPIYLGPYPQSSQRVRVKFLLQNCVLGLTVSRVDESEVSIRVANHEVVINGDLEETLRSILEIVRLDAHILESWSS